MKKYFLPIALLCVFSIRVFAQLSVPQAEAVYGGRIRAITAIPTSSTESRVFISTESANSIFYADMTTGSGTPSFGNFTVMPGAGEDDGYGGTISIMDAHKATGDLYFITQTGALVKTNPSSSSVTTVEASGVKVVYIVNYSDTLSYIFAIDGTGLKYGTLDSSGTITPSSSSPLTLTGSLSNPEIYLDPSSKLLYIADINSSTPTLAVTKDKYNAFTASTTISSVNTAPLATGTITWTAFAIGNDGTYFFGGNDTTNKFVAYSKDGGSSWTIDSTGINGVSGPNFAIPKTGDKYIVYFSSIYAAYDSLTGFSTWKSFGNAGLETHPNDGIVYADPIDTSTVYVTTDQGLGVTTNEGPVIKEIDNGIAAVQINDFDLDSAKTTGWVASKSGIRRVSNYTSSPAWSLSMFPNSDGSPYYSADMVGNDTNSAYVGNLRVYKTNNAGANWNMVFKAETTPYNFSSAPAINAIEVNPNDTSMVLAGYSQESTSQGGVFYSTDGGGTWAQFKCLSTSGYEDVDVRDIVFTQEGGHSVAYIGVSYDATITDPALRGKSVYRAEWSGSAWSVRQDMESTYTSSGSSITASIKSLTLSVTGDTLYASGEDEAGSNPKVYYKILSGTNLWTELTVPGIPGGNGINAMTEGNDTLYCAVDNKIYILNTTSGTTWSLGYSYPVGNSINVLYYDDLLVGTGTGLYGQHIVMATSVNNGTVAPKTYSISQNYPNPFNPSTNIKFSIPSTGFVQLKIFNLLGQEVSTLINKEMNAGTYDFSFNASSLASGIYFYQLRAGDFMQVKKMILLK